MLALKMIPHLVSFAGILLFLLRGFRERRGVVLACAAVGFGCGLTAISVMFRLLPAESCFVWLRDLVGAGFLLFWGTAVAAIYRSTGGDLPMPRWDRFAASAPCAGAAALLAAAAAGAICASALNGGASPVAVFLLVLAASLLGYLASAAERAIPATFAASLGGLMAAVMALLLFSSSSLARLDLFAPLTMKVMKFTHDFVHQFFESMLIPDHLFIKSRLWEYIGLLFSKEVGFWGGLAILLIPVSLVLLSINLERLPAVSHIRQGARRRRILADALGLRRRKLLFPLIALLVLCSAVYRSLHPGVEYWDPKPVALAASPSGEIVVPKKGEIDLEDGKLHKFLYKSGGREARFFLIVNPEGRLVAALDACAICKPDGYGQGEGALICYYCRTLIPVETIGREGGCNPVPVPCSVAGDGVHIDGLALLNTWERTVQSTTRAKGGGG